MTDYVNKILQGQASDITNLDICTKRYLQELAALTRLLPDKYQPISLEEYIKKVNRLKERTSSGPSDATLAMVKTEVLDPELTKIGWRRGPMRFFLLVG